MPFLTALNSINLNVYGIRRLLNASSLTFVEDVFNTTTYTGVGANATISTAVALSSGSPWKTFVFDNGDNTYGKPVRSITYDSSGNFYAILGTHVAKLDSDLNILWSTKSTNINFLGISYDGTNDVIYAVGAGSTSVSYIAKFNSSGNLIWQKTIAGSGGGLSAILTCVSVGASGGIYAGGRTSIIDSYKLTLYKFDSSGNITWQRETTAEGNNTTDGYIKSLVLDASENVYAAVQAYGASSSRFLYIIKVNSSGTLQWNFKVNNATGATYTAGYDENSIVLDNTGNIYFSVFAYSTGSVLVKLNSSGTFQWSRRIYTHWNGRVATDGTNIYFMTGDATKPNRIVSKFDGSGNNLWKKTFSYNSNYSLSTNSGSGILWRSNRLYIYGCDGPNSSDPTYNIIIQIQDDGSSALGTAYVTSLDSNYTIVNNEITGVTASSLTLTTPTYAISDATDSYTSGGVTGTTYTVNGGNSSGGLVWIQNRNGSTSSRLTATVQSKTQLYNAYKTLTSMGTNAELDYGVTGITSFNSDGFSVRELSADAGGFNTLNKDYVAWTFRKQPKFFDMVTYTGDGTLPRAISHNLGSTPGFIVVKSVGGAGHWVCYHRSLGSGNRVLLSSDGASGSTNAWGASNGTTPPTSSVFYVGTDSASNNTSGETYIAYLFAHDAGGFGYTGQESIISCGAYTGNGVADGPEINLGWEPQWLMAKQATNATGDWYIFDNIRGFPGSSTSSASSLLRANQLPEISPAATDYYFRTPTGFKVSTASSASYNASGAQYIYIAIRRGPMRTPTLGTSVFNTIARTGTGATANVSGVGFAFDMMFFADRTKGIAQGNWWADSLRGAPQELTSTSTAAEDAASGIYSFNMDGYYSSASSHINYSGSTYINYFFRRAPGFFDIVTYTGTNTTRTISHNLAVVPELIIVKKRSGTARRWAVQPLSEGTKLLVLNATDAQITDAGPWASTNPTSSVFTVGADSDTNPSGDALVAYLFATCPGVSKVGSYTGTAALQTVNCGFTTGARFVLIKRTDSTGDWYTWDSVRGISSGNDPYLLLNSIAAEVTNTNYVDTDTTGFKVTAAASTTVNITSASYIFLAIA